MPSPRKTNSFKPKQESSWRKSYTYKYGSGPKIEELASVPVQPTKVEDVAKEVEIEVVIDST